MDVNEILRKNFEKIEVNGYVLYDCKKCIEKGIVTKIATIHDALFHLRKFHFEGNIYQYFDDIKKIYGRKKLKEMVSNGVKK